MSRIITIFSSLDLFEVQQVQELLEEAGIPTNINHQDPAMALGLGTLGTGFTLGTGGHDLQISEAQEAKALEIIREAFPEWTEGEE